MTASARRGTPQRRPWEGRNPSGTCPRRSSRRARSNSAFSSRCSVLSVGRPPLSLLSRPGAAFHWARRIPRYERPRSRSIIRLGTFLEAPVRFSRCCGLGFFETVAPNMRFFGLWGCGTGGGEESGAWTTKRSVGAESGAGPAPPRVRCGW